MGMEEANTKAYKENCKTNTKEYTTTDDGNNRTTYKKNTTAFD